VCGHDHNETPGDDQQARSILGRVAGRWPRTAATTSACCWLAAIVILILHARREAFRSELTFGFDDIWLIGLGCVGVPNLLLGLLGRFLTTRACEMISAVCFSLAAGLTALVHTHQIALAPSTADFTLILLIAMAVQTLNGAYGLDKRRAMTYQARAEERGKAEIALAEAKRERDAAVEDAHLGGILQAFEAQHARAIELRNILNANTEDLSAACAILREELNGRHVQHAANGHNGSATILRLVAGSQRPRGATGTEKD
jgi:hypothetical protein